MKVGDLVQKRGRPVITPFGHLIGLIIESRFAAVDRDHMSYRIHWRGDYGTFWADIRDIEVVSESR